MPSVTLDVTPQTVTEDGFINLLYTFTRTGDTSRPLRVKYTVGGTASLGSDYTGISTVRRMKTLVIPAGSTTASVSVDPTADTSVEGDETVSLTLAARNYYTIGTSGPITGIIRNDDAVALPSTPPAVPSVSLSVGPAAVSEDGNANLIYTFTRTGDTSRPLRVKYTVGGTASLGSDYTGISTGRRMKTLVIPAGSTTASVSVDPTADTSVEGDETVSLTLAARNYYTIGTSGPITGIIRNDDAVALPSTPPAVPSVSLSVGPAAVSEDGNANLIYTFTRTGDASAALTVNYTVGGTATIGTDYSGISATGSTKTISFAPGAVSAIVTVDPAADTTVESDESVTLSLAAGTGYTISTPGAVTGTILNDDVDPITGVSPDTFREDFNGTTINNQVWQVATWQEHGGQTGTDRVYVKDGLLHMVLVNDSNQGILSSAIQTWDTFGYGRWEARLKPSDVPGVLNSFYTIDWDNFSTPNVPADGTKQEIDIEFLTKSFSGNSGQVHYAVHAEGRQSMDTNPDISLGFNPSSDFHVYGFDILPDRIDWRVDGKVVYTYKYDGNDITIDSNYQLKLNTWTATNWIGGPPQKDVQSVYLIDWIQFSPLDGIATTASVPASASTPLAAPTPVAAATPLAASTPLAAPTPSPVAAPSPSTPGLPSVSLAVTPATVAEDGNANLLYTFTRTGDTSTKLRVKYTVGGTAVNVSDYTGISTTGATKTVIIAAGSTSAIVTVDPKADTTIEGNETVSLTLAARNTYSIFTQGPVTGTIMNDDGAARTTTTQAVLPIPPAAPPLQPAVPSVSLAVTPAAVSEDGSANLIYTFARTGDTSSALSVNYSVGGTATNGIDYTGISTAGTTKSISFAAGSSTTVVTVDPTADSAVESDESVSLTLSGGTGYTIGTPGAVSGIIKNDDTAISSGVKKGWELTKNNTGLASFGISGSELPVYTGPYTIPAGSYITGVRFTSAVDLSQGDITIEKSLFQPTSLGQGMPLATTTNYNGNFESAKGKVVIRDSVFDGSLLSQKIAAFATGFIGIADLQNNYMHGLGTGIMLMNTGTKYDSIIEGNYVTDMVSWGDGATTGNHVDAFTIRDFTDAARPDRTAIIRNNRFDCDTSNATGAAFLQAWSGRIDNVRLEGNLLEGEGYNLILEAKTNGYSNISAIDNRFTSTGWGPTYFTGDPGWVNWQDNFRFDPSMADGRGAAVMS